MLQGDVAVLKVIWSKVNNRPLFSIAFLIFLIFTCYWQIFKITGVKSSICRYHEFDQSGEWTADRYLDQDQELLVIVYH